MDQRTEKGAEGTDEEFYERISEGCKEFYRFKESADLLAYFRKYGDSKTH